MTTQRTPWTPYDEQVDHLQHMETLSSGGVADLINIMNQQEGYLRGLADAKAESATLLEAAKAYHRFFARDDYAHLDDLPYREMVEVNNALVAAIAQAEKGT